MGGGSSPLVRTIIHPLDDLIGGNVWSGAEDVVVGAPDEFPIAIGAAAAKEGFADRPPRDNGIKEADELIDGSIEGTGEFTGVALLDERVAITDGFAVAGLSSTAQKLGDCFGCFGSFAVAKFGIGGVEAAKACERPIRHGAIDAMRKLHERHEWITDEATGENHAARGEAFLDRGPCENRPK